jgi:hypothetical protein
MIEASPVKFYFAKYFFLGFALLQWIVGLMIYIRFDGNDKSLFAASIFFVLGMVLFITFQVINEKVKRVAIGKNKIIIMEGRRNLRFAWPEVKSLRMVPFFNLYKLRLKGNKKSIYFFPSKHIDPDFGLLLKDDSKMGAIVEKRKKDFHIR